MATSGLLRATPHLVRAATAGGGIGRGTLAVFLQPSGDEAMEAPGGPAASDVGVSAWQPGDTFGSFTSKKLAVFY